MGSVLIHLSRGQEDVERATLAFVVANAGLTAGQESTALLTLDAVWLATRGFTEGMQANGFAPLGDVMKGFVENGGKLWVCGACAKPRGSLRITLSMAPRSSARLRQSRPWSAGRRA